MANVDLKNYIHSKGLFLWNLAEMLKISEATLTRKLRRELSDEEKQDLIKLIESKGES